MRIISKQDYIARSQRCIDHGMLNYPNGISKTEKRRIDKRRYEMQLENLRLSVVASKEYDELFAQGKIRPPTDRERLVMNANGHPDNESVKACQRLCSKKGIDYIKEYELLEIEMKQ